LAEISGRTSGTLCTGILLNREEVARGIHVLEFGLKTAQGALPAAPGPGQFYQVKCAEGPEHILRRPLSAHGAGRSDGEVRVRFLVEVVGWGTGRLCGLEPGEKVGMQGPLGNGFTVMEGGGKHLLIAGGIGVAPLFFLARHMEKSGIPYDMLAGFKSGERCYRPLDDLSGGVEVFTEDGTAGEQGMVSAAVPDRIKGGYGAVYTCGPEAMMAQVAVACEAVSVPCQVSLDARMACGIGICRGCVKEGTGGKSLCVCADGPVFDSTEVLWRAGQEQH
jgi:dihydroorotate dehydrogenase electron transfer subunit